MPTENGAAALSRSDLRHTARLLEAAYDQARSDLMRDIERDGLHFDPEVIRDHNGRFILLDALTALVQAHTVLTATEPPEGG